MPTLQERLAVDGLACGPISGTPPHAPAFAPVTGGRGLWRANPLAPRPPSWRTGMSPFVPQPPEPFKLVAPDLIGAPWAVPRDMRTEQLAPWALGTQHMWGAHHQLLWSQSPRRAGCGHLLFAFSPGFVTGSNRAALQRALRPVGLATIWKMEYGAQKAAGRRGAQRAWKGPEANPCKPSLQAQRASSSVRCTGAGFHHKALITKAND